MALTREIIETSSDHLDSVAKLVIVSLIRELEFYRAYAAIFATKLEPAIDAAEGTLKARMLNGLLKEIESLGIGEFEIKGDREGLWYSQAKERDALVRQMFNVLFDDAAETNLGSVVTISKGNFGIASVGQRKNYTGTCGAYCACGSCC